MALGKRFVCYLLLILLFLINFDLVFANAFDYDLKGNVTGINSPNGKGMEIIYDEINRVSKIIYSSGKEVSFAYDKNDNRIRFFKSEINSRRKI